MDLTELAAYAEEKFSIREQFKWTDFPGFSVLAEPYTGKWVALLMRFHDRESGTDIQRCDIKCGLQTLDELKAPYLSEPFRMKGDKWLGVTFDDRTEPEIVFKLFDRAVFAAEQQGHTLILEEVPVQSSGTYQGTPISITGSAFRRSQSETDMPEKIREMMKLYKYGDNSFRQKCKNFLRQGQFMADYEDNSPWSGTFQHYFPTYHDLNTQQLRGYFTWRTNMRKGNWQPVPASMAYIYIYELLNGIGTASPEDSIQKLKEFETNYIDSGLGEEEMRKNLRRWMLEFSIINRLPTETVRAFADPEMLRKDESLLVLKDPQEHTDEEIFSSLCIFAGEKLAQSPVITKNESKGIHLFAEVWRYGSQFFFQSNKNLFTTCFGTQNPYHWYPLANAVYFWQEKDSPDMIYDLDPIRRYECRYGVWMEKKFENIFFEKKRFQALIHEADRQLRLYLKTGHALREKPEESWAAPYVQAIIEIDRKAEQEAAKPKITIDLSGLERIRQDAEHTRDSLLTEEEMEESVQEEREEREEQPVIWIPEAAEQTKPEEETIDIPLDQTQIQILRTLLRGENADALIRENHLLPSVVTDAINEALFDEIGDSILECDDNTITIVEDYKEDIIRMLGGTR